MSHPVPSPIPPQTLATLKAHLKIHDVAHALEIVNLADGPTAFALFVLAWENLKAQGWGATRIIEAGLVLERERGSGN